MKAHYRNSAVRCLAAGALLAAFAASSPAATKELWAKAATVTIAGSPVQVWGYSETVGGTPTVPGPRIVVPDADTSLSVVLHNALSEPTSLVIRGQAAAIAPTFVTDSGDTRQRVQSFNSIVASGGQLTYTWNNLKPGTYIYASGYMPGKQIPMGLYGAMTHDAGPGLAYPGIPYSAEVLVFYSEIDPGLTAAGEVSRPLYYNPRYFLVNGKPFEAGDPATSVGAANQAVLFRFLNAGLKSHAPTLLGSYMRLVAEDGNPYPYSKEKYTTLLAPGKTKDALWTPTTDGTYPLFDQFGHLTTNGQLGGGLFTRLTVGSVSGAPVVANGDSYSTAEDATLTVPTPGVLGNDTGSGTLAAAIVTQPAHGSVTLSANGSFVYIPMADYNGADEFTYRATNGAQTSNTATVSLNITPVVDPVVAVDDVVTTGFNTQIDIRILDNDSSPDGNPTLTILTWPPASFGIYSIVGTGVNRRIRFVPAADVSGVGTFTYEIARSGYSSTATVTVTVLPNQPPVAVDDATSTTRNTNITGYRVWLNDSDPDGALDTTSVRLAGGATSGNTAAGGTVTVNTTNGRITYRPKRNYRGSDSFTYTISDDHGAMSNVATVRINVN